ncbi:hypothetical protein N7486_011042 [Penicillium sp. IBT 16267x]|nr:hypothetical protein N7486_011042 [Penicillium sp. IBT 16267x]
MSSMSPYSDCLRFQASGQCKFLRADHMCNGCLYLLPIKASALHDLLDLEQADLHYMHPSMRDHQSILERLDRVEAALGIDRDILEDPVSRRERKIVNSSRVPYKELGMHAFGPHRDAFNSPTPLLLASVLYISALHHKSSDMASLEAGYFTATCCAIADLGSSNIDPGLNPRKEKKSLDSPKCKAFHNILGLIMASLSSEAYVETTGLWIAMGYRLWLDNCPFDLDASTLDWRGLFSGLQVIDIEHASIHMSYPLIPRRPPTPGIQCLDGHQGNAFQGLAEMMHFGLSHFVGRGLPTIWCSINADVSDCILAVRSPFTERDSEVIRLWARKLDDWLVRYNGASQPSPSDRHGILILLQYHLHKLYVLSIYHPARGFDLSSANMNPVERHELLVSARAVLRLRQDDASIWSNWDLIMITWAAILLLRGVEDGMTHPDDLHLIQSHLQSLERSSQSTASIHTVLSQRLESNMQAMHTPPDTSSALLFPVPRADDSWTIFDHQIMSIANPPWLFEDSTPFSQTHKSISQTPTGLPVPYAGLLDSSAQ